MGKYRLTQLGVYIELFLHANKMTQMDFAKEIGCSQGTVNRTIRGEGSSHRYVATLACKRYPEFFEPEDTRMMELHGRTFFKVNTRHMDNSKRSELIDKIKDDVD